LISRSMKKFKVVSVDMFGTLVDISSVRYSVWSTFLGDRYTPELADKCWERGSALLSQQIEGKVVNGRQYIPPRAIFEMIYSELFAEIGLDFDLAEAARVFALQHSYSRLHGDAMPFLERVGRKYPVCLSSDTDEDMLGDLRQIYPFDYVVTSEQVGAYKTSDGGRFFSEVIKHYGISPDRIVHIGDSLADVIGAKEAGIASCWLNRKKRAWRHDVMPDYEVNSLTEAASLLGVDGAE